VKNTLIYLISRLIKIVANLSKLLCYGFHFVFPHKRFTLPEKSAPLLPLRSQDRIPHILWQTNYTNRVTLPVYLNYLFNRLFSPSFEYRFMITADRAEFIQQHFSREIFDAYSSLQIGAAQADFWRLLVLYRHGGVYMDIDAHVVWPLGAMISGSTQEIFIKIKDEELSNFFIASCKENPHLDSLIKAVLSNIQQNSSKNIYELTGPGVFNKVLNREAVNTRYYRYTCNQGNFTNEYFQYLDKPQGKWTKEQEQVDIIKK
jgi:mannosyltransferase OCH1-like enzyme